MNTRGGAREGAGRKDKLKGKVDVQFRLPPAMFESLEQMRQAGAKAAGTRPKPRSTWYRGIVEEALDTQAELPESPLRNDEKKRQAKIYMSRELFDRVEARMKELDIAQMAGFIRRVLAWHILTQAAAATTAIVRTEPRNDAPASEVVAAAAG